VNEGVERLHPALPWAFGSRSVLLAASARETAGVIVGSFTENRAFQIPPSEPSVELPGPGREAVGIDSRLWGVSRMKAPKAWAVTRGEGVIVAVVDTGVDASHPALANNIALNEAEKNGRAGVDVDGNGYVDDVTGWDFFSKDSNPDDNEGHGSHVAGTRRATLLLKTFLRRTRCQDPCRKTHNNRGASREDAVVKGILYAADRGAKVSNCSRGGAPEAPDYSAVLFDAIKHAGEKGALLVAAAGNDGSNNDRKPSYPSNYQLENVMAVA